VCGKAQLTTNRRQCQIDTDGELEKWTCNPVEQEENHEKGPRWSWARNPMGNINLGWPVYELLSVKGEICQ
jgi:hypothetical protein